MTSTRSHEKCCETWAIYGLGPIGFRGKHTSHMARNVAGVEDCCGLGGEREAEEAGCKTPV